jgi:hypothetical protein
MRKRLSKKLTREDWKKEESTVSHFKKVDEYSSLLSISADEWAAEFLNISLDETVPEDIRDLFEVAQGVLCYGIFFYPLYSLGAQQTCPSPLKLGHYF